MIGKFPYKTSKDYKQLFELIKNGSVAICIKLDGIYNNRPSVFSEVGFVEVINSCIYVRSSVSAYNDQFVDCTKFVAFCEAHNLEFIEPTFEVMG